MDAIPQVVIEKVENGFLITAADKRYIKDSVYDLYDFLQTYYAEPVVAKPTGDFSVKPADDFDEIPF